MVFEVLQDAIGLSAQSQLPLSRCVCNLSKVTKWKLMLLTAM